MHTMNIHRWFAVGTEAIEQYPGYPSGPDAGGPRPELSYRRVPYQTNSKRYRTGLKTLKRKTMYTTTRFAMRSRHNAHTRRNGQ